MAVPTISEINNIIASLKIRLNEFINNTIKRNKLRLDNIKSSYILKNPLSLYEIKEQKLDNLIEVLNNNITKRIDNYTLELNHIKTSFVLKDPMRLFNPQKEKLLFNEKVLYNSVKSIILKSDHNYKLLVNTLKLVNPLGILEKGYSLVTKNDLIVTKSKDLEVNDLLNIRLYEGSVEVEVTKIN